MTDMLRPSDEGYEPERRGFQTGFQHSPAVIVGAVDEHDVCAAVAHAADAGLGVSVQATGHGTSGLNDGGVLISTRRMDGVQVFPARQEARIEAGVQWRQVIAAAAPHGLAPLSGSSPTVGAVGYALGGGLGLLGREFGFAADHVLSLDVVTADGKLRSVDASNDPELFWGLRGGRDHLGVVTSMTIRLFPVERIHGGGLFFDVSHAREVISAFRDLTAQAPETLTASLGMVRYPPVALFPEPLRDRHVLHFRFASTSEPERLIAPVRAAAPAILDQVRDMPFTESGSVYNDPEFPHSYYGNNVLLSSFPAEAADAVRRLCGPAAPVPVILDVRHLGGALSRPPAEPNCVGHREAQYIVRVLSPLATAELADVRRVHRRIFSALAEWTVGQAPNFRYGPVEELGPVYDEPSSARLRALKEQHDPSGLFRALPEA
ncbi:FAD-binding oxidoreductase [Saccharopolyspora taberi]|uniref:FAD-binding oxidoreductase n=1 Tax=Saccharopolyspora taberi TaxID=60895 RepID=A0ABN3V3J6_9PSEU